MAFALRLRVRVVFAVFVCAFVSGVAVDAQSLADTRTSLARDLQIDLSAFAERLSSLARTGTALGASERGVLAALVERIRATDLLISDRQQALEERLTARRIPGTILQRHRDAVRTYREHLARTLQAAEVLENTAATADQIRRAISVLSQELADTHVESDRTPLGVTLPFRSLSLPQVAPQFGTAITPAYLTADAMPPVGADLAASLETELTADVRAKATALGRDPIAIFEFVQNQIRTEFYYGAMKSASDTLRQASGNDTDQASLLIALLRASGIASRYVRGVIALSGPQALEWTGTGSTRRAADVFTRAGIPFRPIRQGATIGSFEVEHTWVEAYVPYANYRGVRLGSIGQAWIPLDASFKSLNVTSGQDLLAAIGFTADSLVGEYLALTDSVSPADFFRQKITSYLAEHRPDLTFDQAVATVSIRSVTSGLLPSTLPYPTVSINEESADVPDRLRHRVRFVAEGEGGISFEVTLAASELSGRRITLSYIPSTVEDQAAVHAFLGLSQTPAYLVKLRPVLKVGGIVKAAGATPVQMGALHSFTMDIQTPRGVVPIANRMVAGGYYAIALGTDLAAHEIPQARAPDDTEGVAADRLYSIAADYVRRWNDAERLLGQILRVIDVRPTMSEVIVGTAFTRTLLFGQPQGIEWRGVFVDADFRAGEPVPMGADDARGSEFMRLAGLAGSALEGEVLQVNLQADAVSAARLIQLARQGGIAIEEVTAGNLAEVLARLRTAAVVRTDIEDAVAQGWRVTIPRQDLTRNLWTGIGYIVLDPATGSGGYFISGGHAGGDTTESPQEWANQQLAEELGAPYEGEPNTDPTDAFSISKVTITDHQNGTVGEPLERALAVWVRDRDGVPVKNAEVIFDVQFGGGNFDGLATTNAFTDHLGIAEAVFTLGTSTSALPSFVRANADDPHLTKVGQNIVTARVTGSGGTKSLDAPFQHFAHPGPPVRLLKVLGDNAEAATGTAGGSLLVRAEDEHGNPVSNVPVEFSVLPAVLTIPPAADQPLPAGGINLKIYPLEPPCPVLTPILGDCNGQPQLTTLTSTAGAAVNTILGNTLSTRYKVAAEIEGNDAVVPQVFSLRTSTNRGIVAGPYTPHLVIARVELVSDRAQPLNSAPIGTQLSKPLEVALYVLEDDYVMEPIPGAFPQCQDPPPPNEPPRACYRLRTLLTSRIRPVDVGKPGTISYPGLPGVIVQANKAQETANVTFAPVSGGGFAALATNNVNGRYASRLTVGASPALNQIDVSATATIWSPCFDFHNGTVGTRLAQLGAGQFVHGDFMSCSTSVTIGGSATTVSHTVFGVHAEVSDADIHVALEGVTTETKPIPYVIEPTGYFASTVNVDLFQREPNGDDTWLGYLPGSRVFGSEGTGTLLAGVRFDIEKPHFTQLVLNRGTDVEIRSENAELRLISPALLTTSGTRVTTYLDRVNATICPVPSAFAVLLGRDAVVTITVDGRPFTDANGVSYENRPMPGGLKDPATGQLIPHMVPVTSMQVSAPGEHGVVVTAVFDEPDPAPDVTATATAKIMHDVVIHAALAIGHTLIEGVDLIGGHFTLSRDDISIAGHGPPLQFTRSYASTGHRSAGVMGAGWGHNYEARVLRDSCGVITLIGGEGSGIRFSETSPGVFAPQVGYHGSLTYTGSDNSYDFFTKQRTRYHYEQALHSTEIIHRLAFIEDSNGNRLTLMYSPAPPFNLKTVTDASGRTLTFTYQVIGQLPDPEERIVRIDGPLGLVVTYDYDEFGNLKSASRDVRVERYEYSIDNPRDRHNLTRILGPNNGVTGPNADVTELAYFTDEDTIPGWVPNTRLFPEKWEFVRSVTDGTGTTAAATHEFTYDYSEQAQVRARVVDPLEIETAYTIDRHYGATLETRILTSTGDNVTVTRWAFQDGINDVVTTSVTDPNGRRTSYAYDANGNPVRQTIHVDTVPYAPVTSASGSAVSEVVTRSDYHPVLGRVTREVDAEGRVTDYEIHATTGNVLSMTTYPGGGQPPIVTRYSYFDRGLLKGLLQTVTDPRGVTTYEQYDLFGNPQTVVDPAGVVTTYVYDARGRRREIHDTRGHVTTFDYDELDRQFRVTQLTGAQPADIAMASALEQQTISTYFPGGQPRTVTNGDHVTTYAYDALNRQVLQEDPVRDADGQSAILRIETAWDGNGNKIQEIDRRQFLHEFTYDDLNRLTETRVNGQLVTVQTYDAAGNRLTETDLHGHTTRVDYDGLYRSVRTILPVAPYTTLTQYDRVGNVLKSTDANGHSIVNTYDDLNRVTSTTNAIGTTQYQSDASGNRILEENLTTGLRIRYEDYDGLNRPAVMRHEFTDPITHLPTTYTTAFTYIDAENVKVTTSPLGTVTRERFNGQDDLIERVDVDDVTGLQLVTTYRYDRNGNLTGQKDSEGTVVDQAFTYDGLNRRIAGTYPLGGQELWFYDGNGNVERTVDRRGIERRSSYDHLNRKTSDTLFESISNGGAALVTTVAYDDAANSMTVTDANLNSTTQFDDAMHRAVRFVDPLKHESFNEWDGVNRIAQIDNRGIRTEFSYDALNRLRETRRQTTDGTFVKKTQYVDAQMLRIETDQHLDGDANAAETLVQLDPLERIRRSSRGHPGLATRYGAAEIVLEDREYDAHGNVIRVTDANGNVTFNQYDGVDRLVRFTEGFGSPVAADTVFTYDKAGNLLTIKDGRAHGGTFDVRYTYDLRNRQVLVENSAGGVTVYSYDQADNVLTITEPKGRRTVYTYDELNQLLSVDERHGGTGGVTRYSYDANRNRVAQQDANGNLTTYRYDALNRQTDSFQHTVAGALADGRPPREGSGGDEASARHWHFEYDANGNQTVIIDGPGQRVDKQYDGLDRLVGRDYSAQQPDADGNPVFPRPVRIEYRYDANGNQRRADETKEIADAQTVVETSLMEYDPFNRLVLKTNYDGKTIGFEYDRAGNQTAIVDADDARTTFTFDAQNRLTTATEGSETTRYTYWPDDLQRTVTYPNGVSSDTAYDAADRVTQIVHDTGESPQPISQFAYTYDLNGNRLTQIERHARLDGGGAQTTTYQYDAANRLTRVDYPDSAGVTYSYAVNGNRIGETGVAPLTDSAVSRTYSYDRLNQLTAIADAANPDASVALRYDHNGNTIEQRVGLMDSASGKIPAPVQLKSYAWNIRDQLAKASGAGAAVTFDYDYLGRRVKMITPFSHIRYLYDRSAVVQEYQVPGLATTMRYNYGPGGLSSMTTGPAGNPRYFFVGDALGSTSELTDAAGVTQASYAYDAWGKVLQSFDTTPNRRKFTGHYTDSETGLQYFGARYYDDALGRFLSRDAYEGEVATPITLHPYLYANANPTIFMDPTGYAAASTVKCNEKVLFSCTRASLIAFSKPFRELPGDVLTTVSEFSSDLGHLLTDPFTGKYQDPEYIAELQETMRQQLHAPGPLDTAIMMATAIPKEIGACFTGDPESCGQAVLDIELTLAPGLLKGGKVPKGGKGGRVAAKGRGAPTKRVVVVEAPAAPKRVPGEELAGRGARQELTREAKRALRQDLDVELAAPARASALTTSTPRGTTSVATRTGNDVLYLDFDAKLKPALESYAARRGGQLLEATDALRQPVKSTKFVDVVAHGSPLGYTQKVVPGATYGSVLNRVIDAPGVNLISCYGALCAPEVAAALNKPVRASRFKLSVRPDTGQLFDVVNEGSKFAPIVRRPTNPSKWETFLPPPK